MLQYWEQNRRLPLALRIVAEGHPLGLPAGSYVRQYVLASSIRRYVPRGAKSWLHFDRLVKRIGKKSAVRARPEAEDGSATTSVPPSCAGEPTVRDFDEFLARNFPKLTAGSSLRYADVDFGSNGPIPLKKSDLK
jgi:hypothetical protein